jgi:DNA-nicking Smr family endonuclease
MNSFNLRLVLIAGAVLVLVLFSVWAFRSCREANREKKIEDAITETEILSNKATEATNEANKLNINRQINDEIREKVTKPNLKNASVNSNLTKRAAENAAKNYEKLQNANLSNDSDIDLHRRNCVRLAKLFPNIKFPECAEFQIEADKSKND